MSEWTVSISGRYEHVPHPITGKTIDASVSTIVIAEDREHAMEQAQVLFGAHWLGVEPIGV